MDTDKKIGSRAFEMEDLFQEAGVFVNGLTDRPAHMDSYMTVLDFTVFEKTWLEIKDKFTKEEWLDSSEYWISMAYICPMANLLGKTITRKFEIV